MFTVKYVTPDGEENICEAERVIADRTDTGRQRVLLFDEMPDMHKSNSSGIYVGEQVENALPRMHDGIIYVMNRWGATVATYRL